MNDKPTEPVSVTKSGAAASAKNGKAANGANAAKGDKAARPSPPRYVVLAAGALVLSGLLALTGALSLFGLKDWLFDQAVDTNKKAKAKDKKSLAELHSQVDKTVPNVTLQAAVVLLAIVVVAFAAYRGRHWARWAVLGLWVLCTFTQQLAGLTSVLAIGSSEPAAFKLQIVVSGVLFIAAVVLTSLRPSVAFFNLGRPVRADGAAAPRRGLFAPRTPPPARPGTKPAGRPAGRTAAAKPDAVSGSAPDRSRSKQRANADAVAKGAEAARARAKASKSRRTGV